MLNCRAPSDMLCCTAISEACVHVRAYIHGRVYACVYVFVCVRAYNRMSFIGKIIDQRMMNRSEFMYTCNDAMSRHSQSFYKTRTTDKDLPRIKPDVPVQ